MLRTHSIFAGACGMAALLLVMDRADAADIHATPKVTEVRAQAVRWVAARKPSPEVIQAVGEVWGNVPDDVTARDLLDRVIETFALADPPTARFVEQCRLTDPRLLPPEADVLERTGMGEFYTANVRLFFARYLAQRKMYDESLQQFENIDVAQVVDPASCFFFKAVCEHQLLKKKEGLDTIRNLLTNTESVPTSYSTVATLMQYELEALRPESLDEVSRLMQDVERRLDLARTGPEVQRQEKRVIAILDNIIKKIEQQGGGGGGGGGGGSSGGKNPGAPKGNKSSSPAAQSAVGGAKAPGTSDRQNFRNQGGWGNLPPKEREKVINGINEKYPPHYSRTIDEYFRKLAEQPGPAKP